MENPIIENVLSAGWEAELSKLSKVLDDLAAKAEKINVGLGKKGTTESTASVKEMTVVLKEFDATQKRMQATLKEIEAQRQKEITLSAQLNQANTKEASNIAALSLAKAEANRITKLTIQLNTSAAGSYNALSAQYSLNVIELNKYSNAQIQASARLKKLQADTEGLKNSMKTLKEATGDSTLNVGNYGSALHGTTKTMNSAYNSTFQMTQVMRELPNFAIDARIGFMSLSNNLPMLYDGFKQLATQIDSVTGKQKGWGYAWKTMGASLLSMNTAMIVGVTLLTLYGDKIVDFVGKLFKGEKQAGSFAAQMDAVNKVMKDGTVKSQLSNFEELGVILNKAKEGTYDAKSAVEKYNETLGDQYGKVEDVNSALIGYKRYGQDYVNSTIAMAAATTVLTDSADAFIKKYKAQQELKQLPNLASLNEQYDKLIAIARKEPKGFERLHAILSDIGGLKSAPVIDDMTRALYDLSRMDNGEKFIKQMKLMQDASIQINNSQKIASALMSKVSLDFTKSSKDGGINSIEKEAEAFNMLALEMEPAINKAKELANSNKLSFEEREKAVTSWFNLRYSVAIEDEKVQNEKLDKEYKKALKNTKDKKSLDEWYAQEKEKIALSSSNTYISIMDEAENMIEAINKDEAKSEKEKADEIAKIRKEMHTTRLGQLQDEIDKWNKIRKQEIADEKKINEEKRKLRWDLAKYSVDIIAQLGDSLLQRQLDQLDEQNEAYKKSYDERIAQIEGMGLSEEETTKEKAAAEAYYQSQLEQTKQREKELQREQFLLNQLAALAQVAINTAVNITENPALTGLYIALGAAQAAVIAAQTIPAFAEGGKIPHVGDGLITENSNIARRSNGDSLLAYLTPKTETVITHDQMLALGGAWAMKQAGVPGYEDARYQPDMTDIRAGYNGKTGKIIVNANFESEKIVRKLDDIYKVLGKGEKNSLMDTLKMQRYAKR